MPYAEEIELSAVFLLWEKADFMNSIKDGSSPPANRFVSLSTTESTFGLGVNAPGLTLKSFFIFAKRP